MGTEVMRPHDLLSSRRLGGASCTATAALLPRRRQTPTSSPGSSPNPMPTRRAEPRKRREGSPRPAKNSGGGGNGGRSGGLVMGQVTILKRGESLDSTASRTIRRMAQEEEWRQGAGGAEVLPSVASADLIVFGTGQIGPEFGGMPKQIRVTKAKTWGKTASGREEKYAGSAFSSSPSPRALPLPTFSCRRAAECGGVAVDLSATKDLRRLLRLD